MSETVAAVEAFTWAEGFRPAVSASVFVEAHRALGQQLGHAAEASDIVAAARAHNHPLHSCFDWNVRRAAESHWVNEAGRLIRNLRVTFIREPARHLPIRALFRVTVDGERTWAAHSVVLSEADLHAQVARQILGELRAFLNKYQVFLIASGAEAQALALETAVAAVVPP